MKLLKTVATLFIITLGLSFYACSGSSSSPADVVKKSFDLMADKNFTELATLYTKKDGEKMSEDEIEKLNGMLEMASAETEKKDGVKKVTILNETISEDGSKATVKYSVEYGNGKKKEDAVDLMKVDGKWKMIIGA